MGQILIAGDINSDLLKPKEYPGRNLLKSLKLAGCAVHSSQPTRITLRSKTQIDIVALPELIECETYIVGAMEGSDHSQIIVRSSISFDHSLQPVFKRALNKINYSEFIYRASRIDFKLILSDSITTDILLDFWEVSLLNILNDLAPIKPFPYRRKKLPSLPPEVLEFFCTRRRLEAKFKRNPHDLSIWNQLQVLKRRIKSNLRHLSKCRGQKLLNDSQNTRAAWKFIREATFTTKNKVSSSLDPCVLNDYFSNIVQSSSVAPLVIPENFDSDDKFHFTPVTVSYVEYLLRTLKENSATGPDGLPASLLKKLASAIAPNLTTIFNHSFAHDTFPTPGKGPMSNQSGKEKAPNLTPVTIDLYLLSQFLLDFLKEFVLNNCLNFVNLDRLYLSNNSVSDQNQAVNWLYSLL